MPRCLQPPFVLGQLLSGVDLESFLSEPATTAYSVLVVVAPSFFFFTPQIPMAFESMKSGSFNLRTILPHYSVMSTSFLDVLLQFFPSLAPILPQETVFLIPFYGGLVSFPYFVQLLFQLSNVQVGYFPIELL